jgi:hypothetical protein
MASVMSLLSRTSGEVGDWGRRSAQALIEGAATRRRHLRAVFALATSWVLLRSLPSVVGRRHERRHVGEQFCRDSSSDLPAAHRARSTEDARTIL